MPKFLLRDFDDPKGYRDHTPDMGGLPRVKPGYASIGTWQNGESYVPWAVTKDGRVIFARTGEHAGFRAGGDKKSGPDLAPYDTAVSQKRRRLCESALGVIVLDWPHFTKDAVKKVSAGVGFYLKRQLFETNGAIKQKLFDDLGHYFYTDNKTGFGRISTAKKSTVGVQGVWDGIINALGNGPIEQQLSIHDGVGRKMLAGTDSEKGEYDVWARVVREKWFDDKDIRGRVDSPAKKAGLVKATNAPGIAPGPVRSIGQVTQARTRGVDEFTRDLTRQHHVKADAYYDDVDARNLLFGAGISGTTGTLLQAARAFGQIASGELLKQYTLAIVAYLIGGGMHSYHETMEIASRVGVPYNPGGFLPSLPNSFFYSPQFAGWRDAYYDIVVLGATHWRYNGGALPSHLNKNLRT